MGLPSDEVFLKENLASGCLTPWGSRQVQWGCSLFHEAVLRDDAQSHARVSPDPWGGPSSCTREEQTSGTVVVDRRSTHKRQLQSGNWQVMQAFRRSSWEFATARVVDSWLNNDAVCRIPSALTEKKCCAPLSAIAGPSEQSLTKTVKKSQSTVLGMTVLNPPNGWKLEDFGMAFGILPEL